MNKILLKKPVLIMLYGFPGSGKSYFAHRLSETAQVAHIAGDRIRGELFKKPRYDKSEDMVIEHLAEYMADEFLEAGVSVVFDVNASKVSQRKRLRELARKKHIEVLLIWFQIDPDSSFMRLSMRDKRKTDDKFSRSLDRPAFNNEIGMMQHPTDNEQYMVLSGKHSWPMQRNAILRKFFDLRLVSAEDISKHVVKPGLMNLVPASRIDLSRRNINIR